MRLPLLTRRIHKWLALFVGVQALLWTASGLYMTAVHIDIIHGDHFVRTPNDRAHDLTRLIEPARLVRDYPGLRSLRLDRLIDKPVYVIEAASGATLVDAVTGARLSPLPEATIRAVARHRYAGLEAIAKVELLDELPLEVQRRQPPLWRVEFAGWNKPTLYFAPDTGALVARRHELWRIYDFVWMLHIMDYDDRMDADNPLLRVAAWLAVAMALSGAWLLVYAFPRRKRTRAAR